MRSISKGIEPPELKAWKSLENEEWTPTYAILQNPEKRQLHLALLREQGYTCCYCGREIDLDVSHIEHFRPKSRYADLDLAYENLHASCQRETPLNAPLVCGHLKGEEFDEAAFLSPLLPEIETRFSYTFLGEVVPRGDASATMIRVLGLNKPFFTSRRIEALQAIFDSDFLASASEEELRKIVIEFRKFSADGKLSSFFHVVARFAEDLLSV